MGEHAQHWWVVNDAGEGRLEHNPSCAFLARHEGLFDPSPDVRAYVCDVAVAHADGKLKIRQRPLPAGRWHVQKGLLGNYIVRPYKQHQRVSILREAVK